MRNVTLTKRDGRVLQVEHIYIRGSTVRFMILPAMLKQSPSIRAVIAKARTMVKNKKGKQRFSHR